jgi:hypothetical protein
MAGCTKLLKRKAEHRKWFKASIFLAHAASWSRAVIMLLISCDYLSGVAQTFDS